MNARSPNAMGLCSRNILANELVRDSLTSSRRRLPNACQHMRSGNLNGTQAAHTNCLNVGSCTPRHQTPRRQAWRYFGGFWVWLASMLATGAVLGVLLAYGMETAKSALSVNDLVRYNCGRSWFGGQVVDQDNGSSFCAFWIKQAPQEEN